MANTNRYWYMDKNRSLGVVEQATNAVTVNGVTSDYQSVSKVLSGRIYSISRVESLSVLDNAPDEIPEQFHEAIAYKVIAMGYKDPRNLNIELAQYFDMEYEKALREAKKYSRSNSIRAGYIAQQGY